MPAIVCSIDHTADIGLRVRADTPAEAFCALANATFDITVDRDAVEPLLHWTIYVEANGWEDLVITWLEELLYRYETEGLVPHACHIEKIDERHVDAELSGDVFDAARHETRVGIKAVTYHQLQAKQIATGFEIQVIFDI